MSAVTVPSAINLHFPSMSSDTMDEDYQEMSIASSTEIVEANSLLSSWASTGVLTSPEVNSTSYRNTKIHEPLSTSETSSVSPNDEVTGSHTFRFDCYSRRAGFEVGKYMTSDTFSAGGHDWAINLYSNGKKYEYKDYISLYIRLESEGADVNAVFEMMLVDQSGRGKHSMQTHFGFLMRRRGSQWGFGQYMKKKYLEKLGYLKNDCLVVNCVVGVLESGTGFEVSAPSNSAYLSASLNNQIMKLKKSQSMKVSDSEDTKLPDLESAVKVINEFESPSQLQGLINDGDRRKFSQYLYAVDEIQQSIRSGISGYDTHGARAIKQLQLIFQRILDCSVTGTKYDAMSTTVYSSSVTSSYNYELQGSNQTGQGELSSEQIYRLCSIVNRLNSTGCLGDCINVYRISRKSAVDARYMRFCIGRWTINDLQSLYYEDFTSKIRMWILAAYKCYDAIFPGERQYYEQIFSGVSAVTDENCFLAIVKHAAIELNNFAEAVSCTTSFQKLFPVLDLHKVLVAILPKIQSTFHSVSVANISYRASNIINSLTTVIRKLFSSFQDTVLNEQLDTLPSKGAVHSLTEYAMKYVTSISLHKDLLTNIIVSPPTERLGNQEDEQFLEALSGTPLRLHMIWIMISLRINLEGESSLYGDSSMSYIFIMNNVSYVIKTITGSPELLELIGKEYPSKLSKYVLQAAQNYASSTSHKVLYCLRDDGLNFKFLLCNGISKNSVKNRFKTFNTAFEEFCQAQSTMSVLDTQLRCQINKLILGKLLPAYRSFFEEFGSHIQSERFKKKYIKYSSQELENKLKVLFSEH
ncbi:hypothetical protein ACET3Z_004220 [Daucus carota]